MSLKYVIGDDFRLIATLEDKNKEELDKAFVSSGKIKISDPDYTFLHTGALTIQGEADPGTVFYDGGVGIFPSAGTYLVQFEITTNDGDKRSFPVSSNSKSDDSWIELIVSTRLPESA